MNARLLNEVEDFVDSLESEYVLKQVYSDDSIKPNLKELASFFYDGVGIEGREEYPLLSQELSKYF